MKPHDFFSNLLGVNPIVGRFIAGGLLTIIAAIIILSFNVAEDMLIQVSIIIIVLSFVALILSRIPSNAIQLLAWTTIISFSIWVTAIAAQVISDNRFGIASDQCLFYPLSEGCDISKLSSDISPPINVGSEQPLNFAPPGEIQAVYIQYVGSMTPESMMLFSDALNKLDWPIGSHDLLGSSQHPGGLRTLDAVGYNEVRFFKEQNREAAISLAMEASRISPAGNPISVLDLSNTTYADETSLATLEIWISN